MATPALPRPRALSQLSPSSRHANRLIAKVCDAVIRQFIEEELVHQVLDVVFPWWDSRPDLSPVRPCRRANAELKC
jgi:hypothetical protein